VEESINKGSNSSDYEKCSLLSCNAMKFKNKNTFWRNTPPPSSKPKNNPHSACCLILDYFLFGSSFDPEDGTNMFPPKHHDFFQTM
jgi:hypothetical protein